jgi:hypothetical protein
MNHFPEFNVSSFPFKYTRIGVIGGKCAFIFEESHDEFHEQINYGRKYAHIQFDVPGSKIDEFTKAVESSKSEDEFLGYLRSL